LKALLGDLGHRSPDDLLEMRRDPGRGGRLHVHNVVRDGNDAITGEGLPPGEHLIEHHSKREDIGALVNALTRDLFRRHVTWSPEDLASLCNTRLTAHPGYPEIGNLGRAIGKDLDVVRFDVAVDNPVGVCKIEGIANLTDDFQCTMDRKRPSNLEHPPEGLALQELHRDKVPPILLANLEDRNDVRMG
jgi:hypothetical protein